MSASEDEESGDGGADLREGCGLGEAVYWEQEISQLCGEQDERVFGQERIDGGVVVSIWQGGHGRQD